MSTIIALAVILCFIWLVLACGAIAGLIGLGDYSRRDEENAVKRKIDRD